MNADNSDHHAILTLKLAYQNIIYQDNGPSLKGQITEDLPKPPPELVTDQTYQNNKSNKGDYHVKKE